MHIELTEGERRILYASARVMLEQLEMAQKNPLVRGDRMREIEVSIEFIKAAIEKLENK